ncbi:hypothetical protein [Paenibacillus sp. YYML68]|uniref:hypothetical protein n=1 Tax=Paenibacillus sp. YYML68 TaxID=2909250 RepID=UPI00249120A3|nr:hypothetical protein [Paenibacillus sp. YYML68]
MKIVSAEVSLKSMSSYKETYENQESLTAWDNRGAANANASVDAGAGVHISDEARALLAQNAQVAADPSAIAQAQVEATKSEEVHLELTDKDKLKIRLLEVMFEKMTGKSFKFQVPERMKLDNGGVSEFLVGNGEGQLRPVTGRGWGLEIRTSESYSEQQSVAFQASAAIQTADGRTIQLDLSFAMNRSYYEQSSTVLRFGTEPQLKDPLVINLEGGTASLTDRKYEFDLDADGQLDSISFVGPGSGFLALDRNEDGVINDGSELFGTSSGNGFADLRAYDADGNNWIDESDPIFHQLKVWMKDEHGNDKLLAAGQAGIGALYLGHVDTRFQYKNDQQATLGMLQKSGIYVSEQGRAGTIQHIDLAL